MGFGLGLSLRGEVGRAAFAWEAMGFSFMGGTWVGRGGVLLKRQMCFVGK